MATRVVKAGSTGVEFATAPQPLHIADLDSDLDSIYTNIDNTNVKVGAGIATAKLAQDAGIQTGHLAPLAVTTAKIADLGVTTAKMAVGSTLNSSTIAPVPTGQAVTGPVEAIVVGMAGLVTRGANVWIFGVITGSFQGTNAVQSVTYRLYRGATLVTTVKVKMTPTSSAIILPLTFPVFWKDNPPAGTIVYTIKMLTSDALATFTTDDAFAGTIWATEMA